MRISLLGELEVHDDEGVGIAVAGAKQRALLALLAVHAGRPVAADQLVDALWGEDPPAAVRNGLQGLVSKLRRALGSTSLVAMRGGGYALDLSADAVDVHRFEALVDQARNARAGGDLDGAISLLGAAEELWRGDALAEFTYEVFASATITRLTELRLAAIEERVDAELDLGRHQLAIAELEPLVIAHPLRERLRGLLMTALYRAGRQADALRVYQEGRRVLAEELGLEPGPELRRLETAVLAQDPALDAPIDMAAPSDGWSNRRSAIPESLSPLVGRDDEVVELTGLLRERRFVTLVGPGGVGKTRLALEVARLESDRVAGGGCFVELAPVGDPAGVRTAITAALGLPDPNRVTEMIGDRELVLVLDNCEHVIATAAEVAEEFLRRCPGLRLLATSREGLRIGGEIVWPVPPLGRRDAVELFVDRARATGARLDLTDETMEVISEMCARLDGLPLAIELAAARARAFPLRQISTRLQDRFRLLTGGSRTALPRQQTLRAVVDWSYELLFDDERRAFERLSVFPGGCDLATAKTVCAGDDLPEADLEDTIHALVEKSLVIAVPAGDELRFRQLQTLAEYGREKLAERGDAMTTRDAMAAHFARLCARSADAYVGDEQRAWLIAIDREQDNLRGALEWAVANDDAETALTIAGGASWPHWLRGTMVEGKRWLDAAFSCHGDASDNVRGLGLIGRGLLGFQVGAPGRVDADLEEALSIFGAKDDPASRALAHSFYAEVALARGDVDDARRRRLDALASYEAWPHSPFVAAACAYSRGKLALLDGDLDQAEGAYREAAAGFGTIDRPVMRSISLGVVADFDERAGNYRDAIYALEEAVDTNDVLGLHGFMGALLARLGWALLQEGEVGRSELMYRRALDLARRLSNTPVVFLALTGLAVLHRINGRDDEAVAAGTEALDLYLVGAPRRLANRIDPQKDSLAAAAVCCAVLGSIAADAAQGVQAALLLGHADGLRKAAGAPVPTFRRDDRDRSLAVIVSLLGEQAFTEAFERGRAGQLGQDVAFRL